MSNLKNAFLVFSFVKMDRKFTPIAMCGLSFALQAVNYTKLSSDTSLRIKYSALLSVKVLTTGNQYCGRW